MNTRAWRGKTILLLTLLMLVSMSACGPKSTPTVPSKTSTYTPLSNIPLGSGNNPEPGTDGKPRPTPNGHSESIFVANDLAFIGSDNGALYALGARDGTVHWQHKIGSAVFVFAAANGVVYVTADRVVYATRAYSPPITCQRWSRRSTRPRSGWIACRLRRASRALRRAGLIAAPLCD